MQKCLLFKLLLLLQVLNVYVIAKLVVL